LPNGRRGSGAPTITTIVYGSKKVVYVGYSNGTIYKTPDITANIPTWERVDHGYVDYPVTGIVSYPYKVGTENRSALFASSNGFNESYRVVFYPGVGDKWYNLTGDLPGIPVNTLFVDTRGNNL